LGSNVKIKLDEIKCPIQHTGEDFRQAVRSMMEKHPEGRAMLDAGPLDIRILRKSLDARKKPQLFFVFSVEVLLDEPGGHCLSQSLFRSLQAMNPAENNPGKENRAVPRPVIAGAGPAGLFAALTLARNGYRPILIERGKTVDERILDIEAFWQKGCLLPESNVQFGEGGAGTFSDGKLNTGIKDGNCKAVLETFVDAGAPEEILYMAKPHIGTDLLRNIVKNIRKRIESLGGTVLFETRMDRIIVGANAIQAIEISSPKNPGETDHDLDLQAIPRPDDTIASKAGQDSRNRFLLKTDAVILAIGQSARDTIRMLSDEGVLMQSKPFSMGVRIEHLQKSINESQYGQQNQEVEALLPAADYKLSCHLENGRDVYTFCMCPGGQVIGSASGEQQVVTNGMSLNARNQANANSAVLVSVDPSDFDGGSPLAGIDFQEHWEKKAFVAGGGTYKAPAQLVGDFLQNPGRQPGRLSAAAPGGSSASLEQVNPTYTPGVAWTSLNACLPPFVAQSIRLALPLFDRKLHGFASPGAVMTAIESRSSSPVRIMRDQRRMATVEGLYPCGEGAGYAGGIMSAAVDGIASAQAFLETEQQK
jgi:uncharacterized FAD-dependent dehydrogenase